MKTKTIKVLLSIIVLAIIVLLIFSDITNKLLIIAALFIGYAIFGRVLFPAKEQGAYSKKFTQIYRMIIIPLVVLLFISGLLTEVFEDKSLAFTIFIVILYLNLAAYSLPIFYRIINRAKNKDE